MAFIPKEFSAKMRMLKNSKAGYMVRVLFIICIFALLADQVLNNLDMKTNRMGKKSHSPITHWLYSILRYAYFY